MPQENILVNDIISDHRERMLNLKKYYPFFKLSEVSFSWYKEGIYDSLDMGYILMAVLRFFIEENNFKERDVTYAEYAEFMNRCIRRDFKLNPPQGDMSILVDYIFDKLKNDGKPFVSKDFKGGTDVVRRINKEVDRLWVKKNQVMALLSADVFTGLEAYEEFFGTGIRWFDEEQKLFVKNSELIDAAQRKAESDKGNDDYGSYLKITGEIYQLDTELKIAMNNHLKLLSACTQLGIMADEMVKKAKLGRLRPSFDFRNALELAMKKDDMELLGNLVRPVMGLKLIKTFPIERIGDMITYRPEREEQAERIENPAVENIVYDDELEDARIRDNYAALIKMLLAMLRRRDSFDLRTFNESAVKVLGDTLFENGDYYSFLVHLCQKKEYVFETDRQSMETFLDEIFRDCAAKDEYAEYLGTHFSIEPAGGDEIEISANSQDNALPFTITNIIFRNIHDTEI